ncbi:MAG: CDP-alcohol phosphatidyltransferase family protein [Bacteroidota bacterium]
MYIHPVNLKKHIPNTITLGNLFCGCLAIVKAFEGDLVWAAYLVGIALVLDFFDGFTARMLKVSSAIGKDLDSLADMVTFGVVPGIVMFQMIFMNLPIGDQIQFTDMPNDIGGKPVFYETQFEYLKYVAFIITIFSCIRLAKFNNDTRQSDSFIGLPTPANTMVICSLPLIIAFQPNLVFISGIIENPWFLCVLSLVMSLLLIAEIPLFALKFKNFSWASNKLVYLFLLASVVMILTLHFLAIPLVIILYILLSIVNNIFLKDKV